MPRSSVSSRSATSAGRDSVRLVHRRATFTMVNAAVPTTVKSATRNTAGSMWYSGSSVLLGGMPLEGIPRAVQNLTARRANRHEGGQDGRVEPGRDQAREEPAVDGNGAYLRVVAPEVDGLGSDHRLIATHLLLGATARRERDERLRPEAQTRESEALHREAVAGDVVSLGVRLKGRLGLLFDRCRGPF